MIRFGPAVSPPEVWAVEDTVVQICWGDLPAGPVVADADGVKTTLDHGGGPGGLDLDGLPADTNVRIELSWTGGRTALETRTLPTPPGEELYRFATVSDLHLGAIRWGAMKTMVDRSDHPLPHPYRCAIAAIEEAVAWGAQYLIIKGDAAQHETGRDFEALGRLVDHFADLPMMLLPGNHDVDGRPGTIPLTVGARELPYVRRAEAVDLPGVRLLGADTTVPGRGHGTLLRCRRPVLELAAEADRPVFLAIHHQLQATRIPRHWPAGIPAPRSTAFLRELDRLQTPVMVSSGHTHRNRARREGDVLVTEVASTKDYPGVWGGYVVHDGGIRQVVRRTVEPGAIAWTEYSRDALRGLWARWSPGRLDERCITATWAGDRTRV